MSECDHEWQESDYVGWCESCEDSHGGFICKECIESLDWVWDRDEIERLGLDG